MFDYEYVYTKTKEIYNLDSEANDIGLSFLRFAFPVIECSDLELLNECNEAVPAKKVRITGYYCNIDENYISIYLSIFNQFAKSDEIIKEDIYGEAIDSFKHLFEMIDDNSYRKIDESRSLFDLCEYIVNHKNIEIVANILTNCTVPFAYNRDGNIQMGLRVVSVRTYDINDILEKINSGESDVSILNIKDKFGAGVPAVLISSNKDVDVYLTSFVGDWLARLYKEDSIGLLSANVRSYLKRTNKVNKEIIETVKDAPQEFVAYNNGLSAIATGVEREGSDNFFVINALSGFLIVNGGQTTATLFECKNDKIDLSKIIVPAKLAILKNTDTSEYLISNISTFSNAQTAIKRSDPPSNSRFYKTYEEVSKRVMARKNMIEYHCFFERTNGQYNTLKRMHSKKNDTFVMLYPEKSKFSKLQLAKAIIAWEQMPEIVCLGDEKNFEYFHKIVKDINPKIISEEYFKASYALILIYRYLDTYIKKQKMQYKASLIAYSIAILSLKCGKKLDLMAIWDSQAISTKLQEILHSIVQDVYALLVDSPSGYSDIRMWSRKTECWDHVQTISNNYMFEPFDFVWEFLPENAAKAYIDVNLRNRKLWDALQQWINNSNTTFNEFQINMVHGMPAIIYKDEHLIKKMTKKQENFAKLIFLLAVEQGFDFESV